jgi:tRNA(Arg) A34 adenosine deaminase TadA
VNLLPVFFDLCHLAKEAATSGEVALSGKNYHVYCTVIDRKGVVLSRGVNSYQKTHPLQGRMAEKCGTPDRQYLHAEIAGLVKTKAKPFAVVVVRVNRTGDFKMARPCPICMMALKEAGVQWIGYSGRDGMMNIEEIPYA